MRREDIPDLKQVLRYLLGPFEGRILDLIADESMAALYNRPAPSWVAGALIEVRSKPLL